MIYEKSRRQGLAVVLLTGHRVNVIQVLYARIGRVEIRIVQGHNVRTGRQDDKPEGKKQ